MEELATEENHDAHSNVRSSSVTGRYVEANSKASMLGSGALSAAAANSNISPTMDGFGGIVGISAGGNKGKMPGGPANQMKKGPEIKSGGVNLLTNASAGQGGSKLTKASASTPSNAEGGL
mmetsp:Transcript_24365/g.30238  ORF Transcript_24365/g.30238 Transcript_24365/m.30238 type:complete len:121 (-) Transcript_24365:127-489(-)